MHLCVRTWHANDPKGSTLLIHFKLCCTSVNALLLLLLSLQCCALFNFTVDNFRFTPNKYENKYMHTYIYVFNNILVNRSPSPAVYYICM